MTAPIHGQHTMVRTQALGQGCEDRMIVAPTRQTQKGGVALARVLIVDPYSLRIGEWHRRGPPLPTLSVGALAPNVTRLGRRCYFLEPRTCELRRNLLPRTPV